MKWAEKEESRVCAMVKAVAFHQCGVGSISWHAVIYGLSLLVRYKILRGVFLGTQAFSSPKTNI